MTRTTPPRPVGIIELFPELAEFARTATRLHPRPGAPTVADSSIGGPVLWPAGEPWPVCDDGAGHEAGRLHRPADARRIREVRAAASAREVPALTSEERAELAAIDVAAPSALIEEPIPLVPVAQLYRRDVPGFIGPDDADVVQVLWCPIDHRQTGYNPRVRLYWRRTAEVAEVLDAPPEPPAVNDAYLPTPCVVHPEQIVEYPYPALLPPDLEARIAEWEERPQDEDDDSALDYQTHLSLAPGWKLGGHADWSLTDPHPVDCADCGSPMMLLFTAASFEYHGPGNTWTPVEDESDTAGAPTDVTIGRGYSLYVFRCPVSFDHPAGHAMQ